MILGAAIHILMNNTTGIILERRQKKIRIIAVGAAFPDKQQLLLCIAQQATCLNSYTPSELPDRSVKCRVVSRRKFHFISLLADHCFLTVPGNRVA